MSKKKTEAAAATREKPKSRPRYRMAELLEGAEASGAYPLPPEEREWVDAPPVGREWPSDEN